MQDYLYKKNQKPLIHSQQKLRYIGNVITRYL